MKSVQNLISLDPAWAIYDEAIEMCKMNTYLIQYFTRVRISRCRKLRLLSKALKMNPLRCQFASVFIHFSSISISGLTFQRRNEASHVLTVEATRHYTFWNLSMMHLWKQHIGSKIENQSEWVAVDTILEFIFHFWPPLQSYYLVAWCPSGFKDFLMLSIPFTS